MTHADKRMNPIYFGSDLADILIWIRISGSGSILIRKFLAEFAFSECCCVGVLLAAHIELETINFDSRVKMRSKQTRDFVCFNKRGRLAVKVRNERNRI